MVYVVRDVKWVGELQFQVGKLQFQVKQAKIREIVVDMIAWLSLTGGVQVQVQIWCMQITYHTRALESGQKAGLVEKELDELDE